MSLAHALLTSLIEKSSSGYDLARRFDKSIGYFWHATHQQIYRELARMEVVGWIASSTAPDAGKTRKRIYTVLEAGRLELLRWAGEPSAPIDLRDEQLVKLRAAAELPEIDLKNELDRRLVLHREKFQQYQSIEARDFQPGKVLSREAAIHHMILKKGLMYEMASIAWGEEMLRVLESLAQNQQT